MLRDMYYISYSRDAQVITSHGPHLLQGILLPGLNSFLSLITFVPGLHFAALDDLTHPHTLPPLHPNLPTLTTLQAHSIPQMPPG